jgi:hypothetical protein
MNKAWSMGHGAWGTIANCEFRIAKLKKQKAVGRSRLESMAHPSTSSGQVGHGVKRDVGYEM